jgi:hypothetical protein
MEILKFKTEFSFRKIKKSLIDLICALADDPALHFMV